MQRLFHQVVERLCVLIHCLFGNGAVIGLLFAVRVFRIIVETHQRTSGRLSVSHTLDLVVQPRNRQFFSEHRTLRDHLVFALFRRRDLSPLCFDLVKILQHHIRSSLKSERKSRLRVLLGNAQQVFVARLRRRIPIFDKFEKCLCKGVIQALKELDILLNESCM